MSGYYQIWPPPASGGSSGGGVVTVGSMDAQGASVNGANIVSTTLFMQSASSASAGFGVGLVNGVAQSFLGVKTFANAPIVSTILNAQLATNASGQLTASSVSLTTQVTGVLPLANMSAVPLQPGSGQTTGSISLTAQVSGVLPLANTSIIPFGTQTSGSVSLVNQVSDSLPLAQTTGSISLVTQVSGVLPLTNTSIIPLGTQTSGSISLVTQVSGNLPITQTSGSVSLANKVSGTLLAAQFPALTGDITTTAGSLATTLATVNASVGSFTSANITVNAKGQVIAASSGSAGGTFSGVFAYYSANASYNGNELVPDTVLYDTSSFYNSSTGVFTAPATGKYLITVNSKRSGGTTATAINGGWLLEINSVTFIPFGSGLSGTGVGAGLTESGSIVASLTSGDTFVIAIINTLTGTNTIGGSSLTSGTGSLTNIQVTQQH